MGTRFTVAALLLGFHTACILGRGRGVINKIALLFKLSLVLRHIINGIISLF